MRSRRVVRAVIILLLGAGLIGLIGFVGYSLLREPPTINIEADLDQPSTAIPAQLIRASLDKAGFKGELYDNTEYDLIGEKVQDTKEPRGIDIGITARPVDPALLPDVVSLGTISQAPLLFIARSDGPVYTSPADLRGKRIQIGQSGTVSNELGTKVLAQYGVNASNTKLLVDKHDRAHESLLSGDAQALIELYSPDDTGLSDLFDEQKVRLIPEPSTQAVAGKVGYVVPGILPRGAYSVTNDVPSADVTVIEVPVTVIARAGLSRAAVFEVASTLNSYFARGTVLAPPGTFPSFTHTIPSDPAAVEFYDSGIIPWQYRTLPAPIADLFIPLALIGSIMIIGISVYQLLFPDALHIWQNIIKPRRHRKRASMSANSHHYG